MRYLIGLVIGVGLLVILVAWIDVSEIANILKQADLTLLLLAMLLTCVVICMKVARLALLIKQPGNPRPARGLLIAYLVGLGCNVVMPARIGELVRSALLHRRNRDVPVTYYLTCSAVGYLLDFGILLMVLFGLIVSLANVPVAADRSCLIGIVLSVLTGGLVCSHWGSWRRKIKRLGHRYLPPLITKRIIRCGGAIRLGTDVLSRPRPLIIITGLTFVIWLLQLAMLSTAMAAFHISSSIPMVLTLMVFVNLSMVISVTPSNVGVHQASTLLALRCFGVSADQAVAMSLALQGVTSCLAIILGIAALGAESLVANGVPIRARIFANGDDHDFCNTERNSNDPVYRSACSESDDCRPAHRDA